MKKSASIVAARRELGRLAEEVHRTGEPVILTRRGQAVAQIAPEPRVPAQQRTPTDAFAELHGTVRLNGDFDALRSAVRELRDEFGGNLDRRATRRRRKARPRA